MSDHSAFEKRYVDPEKQSNVEGLLEHFNLPPKVIKFLRSNKRAVQIAVASIITVVVVISLYGSYKENQIEKSASALSLALKESGDAKTEALQTVASKYESTASGIWAKIELAHLAMENEEYTTALAGYTGVLKDTSKDNPLYGLTLAGIAQAEEAVDNPDGAFSSYEILAEVKGYQFMAYKGMARIHEMRNEYQKALGIYGQFLSIHGEKEEFAQFKPRIEAEIARIKAKQ